MLNVFTYWENKPGEREWPYIAKCIDTIRMHCVKDCKFHHITKYNIDSYIPEGILHPDWKKIERLGIKSDCVRAAVLARYGGLYLDADTVMLRSPAELDTGCDFAYTKWTKPPFRAIAAYVYAKPGSLVAAQWVRNINERIALGQTGWCELGEGALTPALSAAPAADVVELDRTTFMPLDVDAEVHKYMEPGDIADYITEKTICVGLNHSWLTSNRAKNVKSRHAVMDTPRQEIRYSNLMIHRLMNQMYEFLETTQLSVGICVPTFRRPQLLGHLLHAFEHQTYPNRKMIVLDDTGELQSQAGKKWEIRSVPDRYASIGDKRNAIAAMMDTDVVIALDDDDLILAKAVEIIAAGMMRADWVRPSQVLTRHKLELSRMSTWSRTDQADKAFQGSWGVSRAVFNDIGGYPALSLGEDLGLALKLRDAGICEVDPIVYGASPYFVTAPYSNEHFSWECKDYAAWSQQTPTPDVNTVIPTTIPFKLMPIGRTVHKRSWQGDWYKDEQR